MALRNVPFRSDVLTWDPDNLADYFRKVSFALLWAGRLAALGGLGSGLKKESGRTAQRTSNPVAALPVERAPCRCPYNPEFLGDEFWGEGVPPMDVYLLSAGLECALCRHCPI